MTRDSGVIIVDVDPTGTPPTNAPLKFNRVNGKLWGPESGSWLLLATGGGGGGGTVTSVGLSKTDDTNVTAAITGSPVTSSGTINMALGWTGALSIARGGTGTGSTLTGLIRGNASAMTAAELSGDITTSGSNAATLATVNSNVGTFGDSTHVAQVTVNGKGLVTAASNVAISGAGTFAMTQAQPAKSLNTVYQNTGSRPIFVMVSMTTNSTGTTTALTDSSNPPTTSVALFSSASGFARVVSMWVMPNNYYMVIFDTGTPTLYTWTEWTVTAP